MTSTLIQPPFHIKVEQKRGVYKETGREFMEQYALSVKHLEDLFPPVFDVNPFNLLMHFIDAGIPLMPKYRRRADGKYIPKFSGEYYQDRTNWIQDGDTLQAYLYHGTHNFDFVPKEAGLLCLDVDVKEPYHGLEQFCSFFPDYPNGGLRELERHSCVVTTPSGGLHIYYRYNKDEITHSDLKYGLEVKYGRKTLTAYGSAKMDSDGHKRHYIPRGPLFYAPEFADHSPLGEAVVRHGYKARMEEEAARPRPARIDTVSGIPIDKLAGECAGYGHHHAQVVFAGRCKRCGYELAECIAYAMTRPDIFGKNDIKYTLEYCWATFKGRS